MNITKNEKWCVGCDKIKNINKFGKNKSRSDGYSPYCKECRIMYARKKRLTQPDKVLEYYKKYYIKNKEKKRNKYAENAREWRKKYPKACKAHLLIRYAVMDGSIIKPKKCSECGKIKTVIAHHPYYRYDKAYDIVWLCKSCHTRTHRIEKEKIVSRDDCGA